MEIIEHQTKIFHLLQGNILEQQTRTLLKIELIHPTCSFSSFKMVLINLPIICLLSHPSPADPQYVLPGNSTISMKELQHLDLWNWWGLSFHRSYSTNFSLIVSFILTWNQGGECFPVRVKKVSELY